MRSQYFCFQVCTFNTNWPNIAAFRWSKFPSNPGILHGSHLLVWTTCYDTSFQNINSINAYCPRSVLFFRVGLYKYISHLSKGESDEANEASMFLSLLLKTNLEVSVYCCIASVVNYIRRSRRNFTLCLGNHRLFCYMFTTCFVSCKLATLLYTAKGSAM